MQQHLPFEPSKKSRWAGKCNQCSRTENNDGSSVTWVCSSCGKHVCRHCTLTLPEDHPRPQRPDQERVLPQYLLLRGLQNHPRG